MTYDIWSNVDVGIWRSERGQNVRRRYGDRIKQPTYVGGFLYRRGGGGFSLEPMMTNAKKRLLLKLWLCSLNFSRNGNIRWFTQQMSTWKIKQTRFSQIHYNNYMYRYILTHIVNLTSSSSQCRSNRVVITTLPLERHNIHASFLYSIPIVSLS